MKSVKELFERLRFDPAHHLGMGDIRLTIGQQDEILAALASRAEATQDAKDAARYRWLRAKDAKLESILPMRDNFFIAVEAIPSEEALDKLIDEQLCVTSAQEGK